MDNVDSLRERLEALEHQTEALIRRTRTAQQRLQWWRRLAYGLGVLVVMGLVVAPSMAQEERTSEGRKSLAQRLAAVEHQLETLQEKLKHITTGADKKKRPEVIITGANLRVVNGLGSTDCTNDQDEEIPDCPNGLGNLIVGYNEYESKEGVRTGSHNVVVGQRHNFSSVGGLVVGDSNTISGDFAVVSGGRQNEASGEFSSVSGGFLNFATEQDSSVSGGHENTASGEFSSVSGGIGNTASGEGSSVSGGIGNTASGEGSSVSGGENRTAPAGVDWVAGGLFEDF